MGAAETTGARGQRVSDARLATTIRGFGLDAEGWSVAESWLDLRDARADNARLTTALAASEVRAAELERQRNEALAICRRCYPFVQHHERETSWGSAVDLCKDMRAIEERYRRVAMPAAAAKEG